MSNPSTATLAWLRGRLDYTAEVTGRLGNQLGLWLVVGNAAALGLAYQTMVKDGGNPVILRAAAVWFTTGLAAAFFGLALSYILGLVVVKQLSNAVGGLTVVVQNLYYVDEIERDYPDFSTLDDSPLMVEARNGDAKIKESETAMNKLLPLSIGIIVILAGSALAFGLGATVPLRSNTTITRPSVSATGPTLTPAPPAYRVGDCHHPNPG